jgi:hypothetical protein
MCWGNPKAWERGRIKGKRDKDKGKGMGDGGREREIMTEGRRRGRGGSWGMEREEGSKEMKQKKNRYGGCV